VLNIAGSFSEYCGLARSGALDVHSATPVAPTETESKAGLDHFIGALRSVAESAGFGVAVFGG
jgi:glycine cleavage system protein P-like pyridoxal-binding family